MAKDFKTTAQKQTAKLFSNDELLNTTSTSTTSDTTSDSKAKTKEKPTNKKVCSFRSESEQVDAWRRYAKLKGVTMDSLGRDAFNEYIANHPISEEFLLESLNSLTQQR